MALQSTLYTRGASALVGLILATLFNPSWGSAQSRIDQIVLDCTAATALADLSHQCADAGLALHAMHGGIGLMGSAGGPIPVSPSTAGLRFGSTPRIIADAGLIAASFSHPDLASLRSGGVISDKRSNLVGARAAVVVGVFNGFSPLPTVGGFLSMDAVAGVSLLRLPGGGAFSGGGSLYGAGVRVGLLRESFTLPGVTLSAMHYRGGDIRYGDLDGSGSAVEFSPRITSFRTTVGKDLLALGVSGGMGRDQYRGQGSISAYSPAGGAPPGGVQVTTQAADLSLNRHYLFLGGTYTFIVFQVAGEAVWSRRTSNLPHVEGSSAYRPGGRELQGALSFRLTY